MVDSPFNEEAEGPFGGPRPFAQSSVDCEIVINVPISIDLNASEEDIIVEEWNRLLRESHVDMDDYGGFISGGVSQYGYDFYTRRSHVDSEDLDTMLYLVDDAMETVGIEPETIDVEAREITTLVDESLLD